MSWLRYECFRDPIPVSRDNFLVSHSPADHFGLYLIDRYGNRELLYMDPTIGSMRPRPLRPVTPPPVAPPVMSLMTTIQMNSNCYSMIRMMNLNSIRMMMNYCLMTIRYLKS